MRLRPLQPKALAALALLAWVAPAQAQIFTGGGGAVGMPGMMAPAAKPPTPVVPTPVVSDVGGEILRFLPGTLDGLKVSGEIGALRWPVYLSAAQAAAPVRVRVGYVSAVSLLPDASSLEVKVNDTSVGVDWIDAPRGSRAVEFVVPAGLLKPGFNAVAIDVRQRHRVDCSVAATYELWTRIDPTETGLVLASDARTITDIGDLAALLPRADGTLPLHVVLTGKTNPVHLRHLVTATQMIALGAHALQPSVDFTPAAIDPYGVDLALGLRDTLARLPRLADVLGVEGPLLRVLPAVGEGRPTLVVTGSTDAELEQAIAQLAAPAVPVGTPAGLLALANYPAMATEGATHLKLRELGIRSQDFTGRFYRRSFNLALPADFLASDYGRGTFDLAGGYAAGLTLDAQVRVDVNGRNSGIIKLPRSGGEVFQHNQLFLPLSLLRPGLNSIEVFAETPRPEDASCTAVEGKRFLFLDSSEIVLPSLARVQRLPDLAMTTGGGLPFTTGVAHLVVPKPERETMGAALSLTARAAVAAGVPIPFDFSTKMPTDDLGSTLVVSPAQALDPALMATIGLDPKAVEAAWRGRVAPSDAPEASPLGPRWWLTRNDGPAACRAAASATMVTAAPSIDASARVVPPAPVQRASAGADGDMLLDSWTGENRSAPSVRERVAAVPGRIVDWTLGAMPSFPWPGAKSRATNGIDAGASLILAQGITPGSRDNVTTIVTAADPVALRSSVACLFDPRVWAKVHGRLAVVDAATGGVTATDATSFHYVASSRMSLANSRLVIAGWFSLNPLAFVAFALLTALCLGGTTLWFVRGVGRRSER